MNSENKESRNGDQNSRLLAVNSMFYRMPKPLSVSVVTTQKKQYSSRNEYLPKQTIIFDLNCNSAVNCDKSYMKITVQALNQALSFESGSVMNLFSEIRILSKNGAELDRISNANHWYRYYIRNCIPQDKLDEYGFWWGSDGTALTTNSTRDYIIPLSFISGLFRPHGGVKLPPQLLSGARIEIELEEAAQAVFGVVGVNYVVYNPEIQLDESTVNDNILKILSEESANNGLEITYDRVFSQKESIGTQTTFNTQIKKAVSQCTKVVVVPINSAEQNQSIYDSFKSLNGSAEFKKYQFRLASNYFPNQEVNSIAEAHILSSQVCEQKAIRPYNIPSTYVADHYYLASQIKTDEDISSSGIAINNSSSLAVNIESQLTANEKTYNVFMVYTALARAFLSQVSVKI